MAKKLKRGTKGKGARGAKRSATKAKGGKGAKSY